MRDRIILAAVVFVALCAIGVTLSGCGGPQQKADQNSTATPAATAKLEKLSADVILLEQQNKTLMQTIQNNAQDANQFRTEIKDKVASLTQNQFRTGQWVAEASDLWRLRLFGPGHVADLVPVGGDGPVVRGNDRPVDNPGADVGRALSGPVKSSAPVTKKGHNLIGFIVGVLVGLFAFSIVDFHFPALTSAIEVREDGLIHKFIAYMIAAAKWAWSLAFGKKKDAPVAK